MGPDAMIFVFWMLSFKPTFSLSSFTFIKRLFSSSSLSAQFSFIQLLSCVRLFATPWNAPCQASLSITNSWSSLRLNVRWVGDAIQPSHPLSSPSPPALNPSQHQSLSQWINCFHEVAKYWSFSFSIIPSKEIPGLISFRMDWLDLLAVQGTLKTTSK